MEAVRSRKAALFTENSRRKLAEISGEYRNSKILNIPILTTDYTDKRDVSNNKKALPQK
jgi:hypothetical protein